MAGCVAVLLTMSFMQDSGTQSLDASTSLFVEPVEQVLSVSNSRLYPQEAVAETGEVVDVTVHLFDLNGNPIEGHLVDLVTNSSDLSVYKVDEVSSAAGEAKFQVLSSSEDRVKISAYDVTAGKILDDVSEVLFFDSYSSVLNSSSFSANTFGAVGNNPSSDADYLKFEDIPTVVSVGDSVTFSLAAYDLLDEQVNDYQSKVRFSVISGDSSFVSLPSDYQFTQSDQGKHTFSLSMSFQQPGSYVVEARDLENTDVYGTFSFDVEAASGSSSSTGNALSIDSPISGTYSSAIQVISGKAPIGSSLKIYDNDVEIASVLADVNGEFTYTTGVLSDGDHSIYVALVNEVGTIVEASSVINLNIDTAAPELGEVEIEPSSTVAASDPVTVKFYNTEPLTQAAVLLNGSLYEMLDSGQGFYEASFLAPTVDGDYDLSFIVVDQLGNETTYEDGATLSVGGVSSLNTVGPVSGLIATPATNRVTLTWQPVDNALNYRVFYGISPNELVNAVDTFTDSTTWYIPNLKNGIEYYFAVVAVHENGDISPVFSNIVSAVPGGVVTVDIEEEMGIGGTDALDDMESEVSDTGPGVSFLLLFALLGGYFYTKSPRSRVG